MGFEIETCGPPQIQNTMLNQTRNPGESVHFRCQIDMSKCMVAFIDWYHDNFDGERRKVKSARSSRDPHTHEISRVEARDEGLYTCVVGNGEQILLSRVPQFGHQHLFGSE